MPLAGLYVLHNAVLTCIRPTSMFRPLTALTACILLNKTMTIMKSIDNHFRASDSAD